MSYAEDLAKDRDKYLAQRNIVVGHLRIILEAYGAADPRRDPPIFKSAREALIKIDKDIDASTTNILGPILGAKIR